MRCNLMEETITIQAELRSAFPESVIAEQITRDGTPTLWLRRESLKDILKYLKYSISSPYNMLYDLTAIDERKRINREGQPESDFTLVYHLTSLERNKDIRLKLALTGEFPSVGSITDIWKSANWYECEVFDMFGIRFDGHPNLRRLLMPADWEGYPLRKEHPARRTEYGPYILTDEMRDRDEEIYRFDPEYWGIKRKSAETDFMFLNLGPQHPGTHGLLRLVLQLDGEDIVDIVPDIGYHHRGAEKMAERQTWHKYIPYTDRIDYLAGVLNNLAYLLPVEAMAGIVVPPRAQMIRILMTELFRIESHLVWLGTYSQDLGQLGPVFYTFNDREKAFDIITAVTGGRMHPGWFRIGGVSQDLPDGWEKAFTDFINYMPKRLKEYDRMVIRNRIFRARTIGIGVLTPEEAIEWGMTGPGLRATGYSYDYRKKRPYSGFENFEFDIPTGKNGDCYDRALVRMEEMRQSLRIIRQCIENMPAGPYKSDHPLATPPRKEKTMQDIETLINHFLNVTWGPVIPPGEAMIPIEGAKGSNGYYLVSDGNTAAYRNRIRTPSFPHIQMIPYMTKGYTIPDLLSNLGAADFVLADLDR